jgi:hypothetical protein
MGDSLESIRMQNANPKLVAHVPSNAKDGASSFLLRRSSLRKRTSAVASHDLHEHSQDVSVFHPARYLQDSPTVTEAKSTKCVKRLQNNRQHHTVIRICRPSLVDDLGAIASISVARPYLTRTKTPKSECFLTVGQTLPPEIETRSSVVSEDYHVHATRGGNDFVTIDGTYQTE